MWLHKGRQQRNLTSSHTRPPWSKRLSDLKLGEPKRRRKTSLNAKYDKYRLPSPPRDEQSEEGWKEARAGGGRGARWERRGSGRSDNGLSTERQKWIDDLLAGRLAPNIPSAAGTRGLQVHPLKCTPHGEEDVPMQDANGMGDWTRKGEARTQTPWGRPRLIRRRFGPFKADLAELPSADADAAQFDMLGAENTDWSLPSYPSQPSQMGQLRPLRGPTPLPHSRHFPDLPTRLLLRPLDLTATARLSPSPPLSPSFDFQPNRTSTPRLDKVTEARVGVYSCKDSPSPLYPPTMCSDHLLPPALLQPWPRGGILKDMTKRPRPGSPNSRAESRHTLNSANQIPNPSTFAPRDPFTGQKLGVRFDVDSAQNAFSPIASIPPLAGQHGQGPTHRHISPPHPHDPEHPALYRDWGCSAGRVLSVTEESKQSRADQFFRHRSDDSKTANDGALPYGLPHDDDDFEARYTLGNDRKGLVSQRDTPVWFANGSLSDRLTRQAPLVWNGQDRGERPPAQDAQMVRMQPPVNQYDQVDVESDELNLHSLDGSLDDCLSHRNYPLQVYPFREPSHHSFSSLPAYSDAMTDADCGSVYSPSLETESEDEWRPPKRVVRVSDAAWSSNIPQDVVEPSKETGRRGKVMVNGKKMHRKEQKEGLEKMINAGQLNTDVAMDDTAEPDDIEPIEQFSEASGSPVDPTRLDPISSGGVGASPLVPSLAIAEEDGEGERDEGFFADGGELGFRVWREEY